MKCGTESEALDISRNIKKTKVVLWSRADAWCRIAMTNYDGIIFS